MSNLDANDRDHDTSLLGLRMTTVTSVGGNGSWTYSNDGGASFTALSSSQTVANVGGKLRFSGAIGAGGTQPSLTFTASDPLGGVSTDTAKISLTIQDSGTVVDSAANAQTINADSPAGKVTIVYDALGDATDNITNFNPTQDVIRFTGSEFNASSILAGGINVVSATPTTAAASTSTSDIIFFTAGGDNLLETFIDNRTLQPSTILVQNSNNSIRLWYVQDGVASTSVVTPPTTTPPTLPATVQHTKTRMANLPSMDSTVWQSFIDNGSQAFQVFA